MDRREQFSNIKGSYRGEIVKLNRTLVILERSQIYIVDLVHSFVANCLIKDEEPLLEKPIKRRKYSGKEKEMILSKCMRLTNHIIFCMMNFTTYIMCSDLTSKDYDGKTVDHCNVVWVTMVEKTVLMTKRRRL